MKLIHALLVGSSLTLAVTAAPTPDHPEPAQLDLIETAAAAGSFETLAAAFVAAELVDALKGDGPFTVLAPTDEAFAKLPAETLAALLRPENRDQLAAVLTYHVIQGVIPARDAVYLRETTTLQGDAVRFEIRAGRLMVNDSAVTGNDVEASNGMIHVIDTVLLPPGGLQLAPQGRLVIGVYTELPSPALADQLGIERAQSMLVTSLAKEGGAQRAGLQKYDILTAIAGEPATDARLKEMKTAVGFGGSFHVELIRRGARRTIEVEVGIDPH